MLRMIALTKDTPMPSVCAADRLVIQHDPVGFAVIDRVFNCLPGNDLSFLFKMIIPASEFFQCAEIKRFLIVQDELFTVIRCQCKKVDIHCRPLHEKNF